jgi:hypothetical protein
MMMEASDNSMSVRIFPKKRAIFFLALMAVFRGYSRGGLK